jgi:hypothetical protein
MGILAVGAGDRYTGCWRPQGRPGSAANSYDAFDHPLAASDAAEPVPCIRCHAMTVRPWAHGAAFAAVRSAASAGSDD